MKIRKLRHEGCNLYTKKNAIFQVDEQTFYAKIEKKDATLTSKMETLIQRKRNFPMQKCYISCSMIRE